MCTSCTNNMDDVLSTINFVIKIEVYIRSKNVRTINEQTSGDIIFKMCSVHIIKHTHIYDRITHGFFTTVCVGIDTANNRKVHKQYIVSRRIELTAIIAPNRPYLHM